MNKKALLLMSFVVLSFSAVFTSCNPDNTDNNYSSTLAKVMVVNASPGLNGLDFYVDNSLQNGNAIGYNMTSPYYQSLTGMRNMRLNLAQSAVNIIDINKDLDLNGDYTLIALDTAGKTQSLFLSDDLSEPVLGKAHVRFVHASHNTGAIDIVNLADTSVVFANNGFRSYTAFTPVTAATYSLGYRLLGDSNITSLPTPVNFSNHNFALCTHP